MAATAWQDAIWCAMLALRGLRQRRHRVILLFLMVMILVLCTEVVGTVLELVVEIRDEQLDQLQKCWPIFTVVTPTSLHQIIQSVRTAFWFFHDAAIDYIFENLLI